MLNEEIKILRYLSEKTVTFRTTFVVDVQITIFTQYNNIMKL